MLILEVIVLVPKQLKVEAALEADASIYIAII